MKKLMLKRTENNRACTRCNLIKIRCLLLFLTFSLHETLTSNDIIYGVMSGFILTTDHSDMSPLNPKLYKNTKKKGKKGPHQELFPEWSI
jgi:hypothetical protein